MKTALLAFAMLALAGCHAGTSKHATPSDPPAASTSTNDKASEKARDAMLGKNMKVQDDHWAATPAAAASAATPAQKDAAGGAAPATASTSATAKPAGHGVH